MNLKANVPSLWNDLQNIKESLEESKRSQDKEALDPKAI